MTQVKNIKLDAYIHFKIYFGLFILLTLCIGIDIDRYRLLLFKAFSKEFLFHRMVGGINRVEGGRIHSMDKTS